MGYFHYQGYNGSVEYSEEDNCLCGKILGLKNSLILYEGNSIEELREDFKVSVDSYINRCKKRGIDPEKPYYGVLNIQIPSDMHLKVAMYAENNGTSVDSLVCDLIERRLETTRQ